MTSWPPPPERATSAEDFAEALERTRQQAAAITASQPPERLPHWVVVQGAEDMPYLIIARLWFSLPQPEPTNVVLRAETLEHMRALRPAWLIPIPRQPDDDPVVVEIWI